MTRFRPTLTNLDARLVPAVTWDFSPATGVLTVHGDDTANTIVLSQTTFGTVQIGTGTFGPLPMPVGRTVGTLTRPPAVDQVSLIRVIANGGDDRVSLDLDQPGVLIRSGGSPVAVELYGGAGADSLWGGGGADVLVGGPGDDELSGLDGNDALAGGAGADKLDGGLHHDDLWGDWESIPMRLAVVSNTGTHLHTPGRSPHPAGVPVADTLHGGDGADELFGEEGMDVLMGAAGADSLDGGSGADSLIGGAGNDSLLGGTGADTLLGGKGEDTLQGGDGKDYLDGSASEKKEKRVAADDDDQVDKLDGGADPDEIVRYGRYFLVGSIPTHFDSKDDHAWTLFPFEDAILPVHLD